MKKILYKTGMERPLAEKRARRKSMEFRKEELCRLNSIISVALLSGEVEMDEITESIHKKVADELDYLFATAEQEVG